MTCTSSHRRSVRRRLVARASLALACALPVAHPTAARAEEAPRGTTLTLAQVVAMAKARAPAVHAAFARIASAEATSDRARATYLPAFNFQAAGTGFASNGQVYSAGVASTATTQTYAIGSGSLNLQWTLYDFGRTSSAVAAARAGVSAATLSARATEQVAMAESAVAFLTLLADDALVRSAETIRQERAHMLDITHRLVQEGFRTPLDETRAKVGFEVAELDLSTAAATRESDSVALATALFLDPTTAFRLVPPAPLAVDERKAEDGALAVRARRDVAAAAARVDQARLDVTSAKRAHLPVIAAAGSGQLLYAHSTATYAAAGQSTTITNDGPTEVLQGTLSLTVPIFDPTVNANVHAAEATLLEAQASLEQVSLAARSDAVQAARQTRSARIAFEQAQRLAAAAAANLSGVEDRYANGMESPLALADAQREDALARAAIVRAKLAYDVAVVRLLASISRADDLLGAR